MVEAQPQEIDIASISHQHAGGEVYTATSPEDARQMCPVLGKMSIEEVGLLLELEAIGKEHKVEPHGPKSAPEVVKATPVGGETVTPNKARENNIIETEARRHLESESSDSRLQAAEEIVEAVEKSEVEIVPDSVMPDTEKAVTIQALPDERRSVSRPVTPEVPVSAETSASSEVVVAVSDNAASEAMAAIRFDEYQLRAADIMREPHAAESVAEPHEEKSTWTREPVILVKQEPAEFQPSAVEVETEQLNVDVLETVSWTLEEAEAVITADEAGLAGTDIELADGTLGFELPALDETGQFVVLPLEMAAETDEALAFELPVDVDATQFNDYPLQFEAEPSEEVEVLTEFEEVLALGTEKPTEMPRTEVATFIASSELPADVVEIEAAITTLVNTVGHEVEGEPVETAIEAIIEEIIALPSELETVKQEDVAAEVLEDKLEKLLIKLFAEADITYTPELVESFVRLTQAHYLEELLEITTSDEETTEGLPDEVGTREFLQKLRRGLQLMRQAARNLSELGKSVLRLYSLEAQPVYMTTS